MIATFKQICERISCAVHYTDKQLEYGFIKDLPCDVVQNIFDCVKKIVAHMKSPRTNQIVETRSSIF